MSAVIQIEKNLPIPAARTRSGSKYPFAQMAIGDSFGVSDVSIPAVYAAANKAAKESTAKYSVRKTGERSCRVWRIA